MRIGPTIFPIPSGWVYGQKGEDGIVPNKASTVTVIVTVPERGGMPLIVTVTTRSCPRR